MTISSVSDTFIVSFGKFKGKEFSLLKRDKSYYSWVVTNWDSLKHNFKDKKVIKKISRVATPNTPVEKPLNIVILENNQCILCESKENQLIMLNCCNVCLSPRRQNYIPFSVVNKFKNLEKNGKLSF